TRSTTVDRRVTRRPILAQRRSWGIRSIRLTPLFGVCYPTETRFFEGAKVAAQRMKKLLIGVSAIVFLTWTTLAVQQQVKKIDDKTLKSADKGTEWLSNGMNWGEQRYSTMTQINPQNVGKLPLAWSYELGPGGGRQQATPLYSNGVLYTVTNWSIVAAVDAKTGKEIWRYDPEADRTMTQPGKSRLCCGVNSRGIALYEGKVLVPVI